MMASGLIFKSEAPYRFILKVLFGSVVFHIVVGGVWCTTRQRAPTIIKPKILTTACALHVHCLRPLVPTRDLLNVPALSSPIYYP